MILEGACWRVGEGKSIKIWQHYWLPTKLPTKISSPILDSMEEAMVECLINQDNKTWNHEMIDGIFAPQEVGLIKRIPLAKNAATNLVFWPRIENGQYSCKFGYQFLEDQDAGFTLPAPPDPAQSLWKKNLGS